MAFQADSIFWVEVEKIVPNPYQPRREFDTNRLDELAESIRMYGVLQPLTVSRKEIQSDDGSFRTEYELIAGERRLRAARQASISLVPVIIREGDQNEQEKLELAIIENLQREDLNAVDRALAFRQLADSFDLSHAQVAKKVGRSREYVSNSVRLLALPDQMLDALRSGDISEGHARTLLMLQENPEEQETIFREILLKKLSVREVERIARNIATDKVRKRDKNYDPDLVALEKKFTETLGTRVQIQKTDFGGKVTIDYFSPEDLTYMLERMKEDGTLQDVERRPFAPPQESAQDSNKEVEELTNATPLSALIAQLQQAEEQTDGYATQSDAARAGESDRPVEDTTTEPTAAVTEPAASSGGVMLSAQESKSSAPSDQVPDTITPEPDDGSAEVRVTLTDAPVSLTQPHAREPETARPAAHTPEPTMPQSPRVVRVARERTTAMYVAAVPQEDVVASDEPQDTPQSTDTSTPPTDPNEDDESDLYSIRNFSL
jgi:ParB family chromosome partitioning protein